MQLPRVDCFWPDEPIPRDAITELFATLADVAVAWAVEAREASALTLNVLATREPAESRAIHKNADGSHTLLGVRVITVSVRGDVGRLRRLLDGLAGAHDALEAAGLGLASTSSVIDFGAMATVDVFLKQRLRLEFPAA